MGSNSRIKTIDGEYPPSSPYLLEKLSVEQLRFLGEEVPRNVAMDLGRGIDCERYVPLEDSRFPSSWSYSMRCVESCPTAMQWVRQKMKEVRGKNGTASPVVLANAVKVVALAALPYQTA